MTNFFSMGDARSQGRLTDAAMRQANGYEKRAAGAEQSVGALREDAQAAIDQIVEALVVITERLDLVTFQLFPGEDSSTASAGGVGQPEQHSPYMFRTGDLLLSHQWRSPPTGWLPCAGGTYLIENYPNLYAVIGDRYDRGEGYPEHDRSDTVFRLPQLQRQDGDAALGIDIDTLPGTSDNPGFDPGEMSEPGSGDFVKDLGWMMRI